MTARTSIRSWTSWAGRCCCPGLAGLLYGLSNASGASGFGRFDAIVPALVGAILVALFVVHSARRSGSALVDVRLLRRRPVASASALLFLSGAALYGAMLLLPLYWQEVRGADALTAGLMLVPQGIGTLFSRTLAGRLTDSIGAKVVTCVGFATVGLATIPFALATPSSSDWLLMAALLVRGFGLGAVTIPLMTVAFIGLERTDVPHASILTRIAQQIGGSFGVAVLAVILQAFITANGTGAAALAAAFDQAFWWAVGFTVVAVAVSLALPGRAAVSPKQPETVAATGDR
ncbi:MFS transporter [Arthrobacter livingstonensis]|uniref:MFS transporter n=1 Tax=Arthrobacter livingstonensis TaxID=670078 RepID=UPI001FE8FFDD|nr:MFS transporter [Arthrobacter livingstonensis]